MSLKRSYQLVSEPGFKVLWSKNEGTDKVLEGTPQEYESTAGANLSNAE
ncbi:hypothetical protein Tco_0498195, partial [Tanacetum coccineum]